MSINDSLSLFGPEGNDGMEKKVMLNRLLSFTAALFVALVLCAQDPMAVAVGQRLEIKVNLHDETLSVHVSNIPLVDILKTIGAEAGFKLVVFGSRESVITQKFSPVSLEEGIRRLVGNRSVAVMYRVVGAPDKRRELQSIKEVWLFESGTAAVHDPVANTREEFTEIDALSASADDSFQSDIFAPDAGTESHHSPEKFKSPRLSAGGIKEAVTYPQLDKESDVGYWADSLINNVDRLSREQAITELQRIGSDAAVAAIATVLGDNDVRLRRHAVECLSRIDNDNVVLLLGQTLIGDKDSSVRLCAFRFFANQNSEMARAFLNTAMKDKDESVRALARKALGYN